MRNFVSPGANLNIAAPYAVASGGGALIGAGLFAVASTDTASGAVGAFVTVGVFDLPKAAGVAVSTGAKVYWDNAAKNITTTSAGNTHVGAAVAGALSGDANVRVRLNGVAI